MVHTWMKWGLCVVMAAALAGCAGMQQGPSDEEMISEVVDSALAALKEQDIEAMTANYSEDFTSDQGGGKAEMVEFLQTAKDGGMLEGIEIDTSEMETTIEGEKAVVEPINLEGNFGVLTLSFELEKRDGSWVIVYQSQY